MNIYAKGTFFADYEPVGEPYEADLISVHEFAARKNGQPGTVITRLAEMALDFQNAAALKLDIVGTESVDRALRMVSGSGNGVDHLVDLKSSDALGRGGGTWSEVSETRKVMDTNGFEKPILFGHAKHIGRVGLQAKKAGIQDIIIPDDLPKFYDKNCDQAWTYNGLFWAAHELIGVPLSLRRSNKI